MTTRWGTTGFAHVAAIGVAVCCQACGVEIPRTVRVQPPDVQLEADDTPPNKAEDPAAALSLYSPLGKRDPFANLAATASNTGPRKAPKSRLQSYDLEELRLAFTNSGTSSPLAVVVDPSGRGSYVRVGDFVGKNWGTVVNIKRDEITVRQALIGANGVEQPEYYSLRMKDSRPADPGEDYDLRLSDSTSAEN